MAATPGPPGPNLAAMFCPGPNMAGKFYPQGQNLDGTIFAVT